MEGLKLIPYIALVLTISGIVLGASVITLSTFGDTITKCYNGSYSYNATTTRCTNITATSSAEGEDDLNFSNSYYTIYRSIESEGTIAEQLPTVAIIGVMVIIISVLAGTFVYMRYFG